MEAVCGRWQLDEKSMPGWRKGFLAIIVSEVFQSTIIFFILLNTITRSGPGITSQWPVC